MTMKLTLRAAGSLAVLALLIAAPAVAKEKVLDAAPGPTLLAPADVDPARLLPPPPAEGSDQQKAEIAELHKIQDARTPDELKRAQWDSEHEDPAAFYATLGPAFDLAKLPKTRELLAIVDREQSQAKKIGKAYFKRPRPWIVDATIQGCEHADDKPLSSYPSGHSTMAFSMGVVLADLMPDKAPAILARASDYAHSRLVCGVHYRSDIVAGQELGAAVAVQLIHNPSLKPQFDAAHEELAAAGLTAR
jgi:acid phosphatase (class A)